MMMSATGTTTFTPSQGASAGPVRVTSNDSWRAPFTVPGAVTTYDGNITGFAAITASGTEQPDPPSGYGYDSVSFRDIKSGKEMTIQKFAADAVTAAEVPGLVSK
jgi:hypothetical protein